MANVKLCTHLALRKTSLQKTHDSRGFLYCQVPSHRHLLMFKSSKVTNLHEFTKKSFFYSCLGKFTVYRPLWKQPKINANAVQTQCHVRNVNTEKVYSIIMIIDVWRTRLATKQRSNIN